ncbi:hypothetical protein KSZ_24280 [Dictyobacter formicarum]|uniref:Uncharacterized protein n=1 Tax=Dictyobacter formicarum TaxID=2778368 RepID=A0ABQ3VE49_9CHLR|nr:hypothetical protein KSZ_24280 [Dictyobacter formicarum]
MNPHLKEITEYGYTCIANFVIALRDAAISCDMLVMNWYYSVNNADRVKNSSVFSWR